MNIIEKRIEDLKKKFSSFSQWEDKYGYIITLGKDLGAIEESDRIEANKIKGCQSQVWLCAALEKGHVVFKADSDASITKGVIALLLRVYSDATPDEILSVRPDFLDDIGLRQHLSMSRANGLNAMLKQMSIYAFVFKTKLEMGL